MGFSHIVASSGTATPSASVSPTPSRYGWLRSQRPAAHRASRVSSSAGCAKADRAMNSAQNAAPSDTRATTPAISAASTVSAMRRFTPRWQKFGNSTCRLL